MSNKILFFKTVNDNFLVIKNLKCKTSDLISLLASDLDLYGIDEISIKEILEFFEECENIYEKL